MRKEYDFGHGRRGAVLGAPPRKTRITIRIDDDILQWLRSQMHRTDGGSYQTAMNEALRRAMESSQGHVSAKERSAGTGRRLTALMFKNVTAFRRATGFALEARIRAEVPGNPALIIPVGDEHLFEERGFKFREV
jgi:ferric-dicitrate binding protein FerR (iron transport regulator)